MKLPVPVDNVLHYTQHFAAQGRDNWVIALLLQFMLVFADTQRVQYLYW